MVRQTKLGIPKISVIIPSYNRASFFLPRCLAHLEGEGWDNIEIIVCDDNSDDNTKEVCEQYGAIHLFKEDGPSLKQPNSLWPLFLMGFKAATGKYICWCSSDDYVPEGRFERQVEFLENDASYSAVYGNFAYVNTTDHHLNVVRGTGPYRPELQTGLFCCNATMLMNREAFISGGGLEERVSELVERHMQLAIARSGNLFYMDSLAYCHTHHPGQVTVQGGGAKPHSTGFHITRNRVVSEEEERIYQDYNIGKKVEEYIRDKEKGLVL